MIIEILIPFLGTTLGAATVFFFKGNELNRKLEKALLGFASGVMVAASFFSLLMPALDTGDIVSTVAGFLSGMFLLLIFDSILPHLHVHADKPEGLKTKKRLSKTLMMFIAVMLHNIPEGAAAGVAIVSSASGDLISDATSLALVIGIAIQNFPEGAIVSLPIKAEGKSRLAAFGYGVLTGAVEPLAAMMMFLFSGIIMPIMPFALAFASGAMLYVVIEELIPEASSGTHSNIATIAFALGFALMMVLDVVLG